MRGCQSDKRRNNTTSEWDVSEIGKKQNAEGFTSLPKSEDVNLGNAKEKKANYVPQDKITTLATMNSSVSFDDEELIPFVLNH